MSGHAMAEVAGAIGLFLLATAVLTTLIWQFGATWRAKVGLAREQEYRALAEAAVRAQEASEKRLADMDTQLGVLREQLSSVERVLKQVE